MGSWSEVEKSETAHQFQLLIDRDGTGGLSGLVPLPTIALRDPLSPGSYYDWSDNTFKTSGWTQQFAPMADIGGGFYVRSLNIAAAPTPAGSTLAVEYAVAAGAVIGKDAELMLVTSLRAESTLIRKYQTNRLEAAGGNPGKLRLYEDDAVTLLKTHDLLDEFGGQVQPTTGAPARRAKGTP